MTSLMRVRGTDLRYLLVWNLSDEGPATVSELVNRLAYYGFEVGGRPSKTVSDALRWEARRGRVYRTARGGYAPGEVPRGTEHRIFTRILELRVRAGTLSAERAGLDTACR